MQLSVPRGALLLFVASFGALVYQVTWPRMLLPIIGASAAATTAVLAICMAGMGLGASVQGRRTDEIPLPLTSFGRLAIGSSLTAAATPLLILLLGPIYDALGGGPGLGLAGATLARLLLSALVFGLPSFLIGSLLPIATQAVSRGSESERGTLGVLSGATFLGAASGVWATTFILLPTLGSRQSVWVASTIHFLLAFAALIMGKPRATTTAEGSTVSAASKPKHQTPSPPHAASGWMLPIAAIASGAFILMVRVWYRLLTPVLGGSSYAAGLILTVVLLGLGGGGLIYAASARDRSPTALTFAATCSWQAICLGLPYALGDRLAILAMLVRPLGDAGFGMLVFNWLGLAAPLVLPAAIVAGYQLVLGAETLGAGFDGGGRPVGQAWAWLLGGALLGSIAGGFWLIPWLTTSGTWRVVIGLWVALGLATLFGSWKSRRTQFGLGSAAIPMAIGLLGLTLCTTQGPTTFWQHSPIGIGRMPASFDGRNELLEQVHERRRAVALEIEGVESSVALEYHEQYATRVDGQAVDSVARAAPARVMSVLTGAALHREARRGLVLGLGHGLAAGWLAEVASIERVDVVEVEPALRAIAELSSPINHDVLRHPKVRWIVGDAREFLRTSDETYDLIFSQISDLQQPGDSRLLSREYYSSANARLASGGLLLQALQVDSLDADQLRTIYATVGSVFPVVESWQVSHDDLLLVASQEKLEHDVDRLRRRLAEDPWASGLDWTWGVTGLEGFYSGYLAAPGLATELAERQATGRGLHSDDHPRLEWGFTRNLGRRGLLRLDPLRSLARDGGLDRPAIRSGAIVWHRVDDLQTVRQVAWGSRPELPAGFDTAADHRVRARQAYSSGDLRRALLQWSQQTQAPANPLDRLLLAEAAAEFGDPRVASIVEPLRSRRPVDVEAVLARYQLRQRSPQDSLRHLIQAVHNARAHPWFHPATMLRLLALAQTLAESDQALAEEIFEALRAPFALRHLEEARQRTRLAIANRLAAPELCVEAIQTFEPHVPWESQFLHDRVNCYQRAGHPLRQTAQADLQRFLDATPPSLEAGLMP
ncbi:MAG: fused MFS/spermidine synthase [Acidobacteriota bacterium]